MSHSASIQKQIWVQKSATGIFRNAGAPELVWKTKLLTGSRSWSGSSSRIISSSSWSAVDVTEVLSRIKIILEKSLQCCLPDRSGQVKTGWGTITTI